jgi:hypothetical protein
MDRILSRKAISLGEEYGITAEFIVHQAADQMAYKMEDFISIFDVL